VKTEGCRRVETLDSCVVVQGRTFLALCLSVLVASLLLNGPATAQESPLPDRTTQNGKRFGSVAPEDLPAVLPENDFTRWLNRKRV
jgi:hypothetical protein